MRTFFKKINKNILSILLLFVVFYFINQPAAFPSDEGSSGSVYKSPPRTIDSYSQDNAMCNMKKLDFDPFTSGDDIRWELDNPTCIGFIIGAAALIIGAEQFSSYACRQPQQAAEAALSAASGVPLSPAMIKRRAIEASTCSALVSTCAGSVGTAGSECVQAGLCCGGMAATLVATGIAVAGLAIIYAVALDSQKYARICGHDWNVWEENDGKWSNGKYEGSYQKELEDKVKNNTLKFDIKEQDYREYIYGGREYEDNGDGACPNPWADNKDLRKKVLGYDSDNQKYYMRGPKVSSNFACYRFLYYYCERKDDDTDASYKTRCDNEKKEAKKALECCNNRSQETLCIESSNSIDGEDGYKHQFCKSGSKCSVKGVTYEVYDSKVLSNFVCAKTYSVCPYNHLLGSGTERANYCNDSNAFPNSDGECKCKEGHDNCDTSSGSIVQNYCQYLKHCARVPDKIYVRMSDLDGAVISGACFDMKGDSQNNYSYDAGLLPISGRNFSAPMAQCFKETMENMFLHKAGHSVCKNPDEDPANNICSSGYIYKKGETAPGTSIFEDIQARLRTVIKLGLTIAITIIGINILLGGKLMDRKDITMFVIKLGLVSYFALGNAWQTTFFNGIFNAGTSISNIVMQPDAGKPAYKLDGCQFPRYNYNDDKETTRYAKPSYPPGKEYLEIWDTLDCKIAKALGFGPEVTVPNIIRMTIAGFFTGGLGIVFIIAGYMCAFFMISLTVRALHIFLMSSIAIVLMIYVSPITITLSLFKRTEGVFTKWRKNLISFALQPIVLFTYLGMLISIFDTAIIGSARFEGNGINAPKNIICNDAADIDSLYCIFHIAEIKNFDGFEAIGIGIPILVGITSDKLTTVIKAAFILFIFTQFLEKITQLASELTGGKELKGAGISAMEMATKSFGAARGLQKRAMGLSRKIASGVGKKATSVARSIGNTGKNPAKELSKPGSIGDIAASDSNKSSVKQDVAASDKKTSTSATDPAVKGKDK